MSSGKLDAPPATDTILITGVSGKLGRVVAKRLYKDLNVVGVDRRPFPGKPRGITHYQCDVRSRRYEDVFREHSLRAVVHLNIFHNPRAKSELTHDFNLTGTQATLEYCVRYRVPKLIVLSSADVYGPQPRNSHLLTEDAPLMAGAQFPEIRDLIAVDMLCNSFFWKYPEIETVVLRPVHILGSVRNAPSNYLRLKYPWKLIGFDPMVQVIHIEDLAEAMVSALKPKVRGVFNVVGPGAIPLSTILRLLERRVLPMPAPIAKRLLGLLWRFRLASFPAPEIDFLHHVCTVDGSRAREVLGFEPRYNLRDTVQSMLEYS